MLLNKQQRHALKNFKKRVKDRLDYHKQDAKNRIKNYKRLLKEGER